jgi:hypothetical protein
MIADSSRLPGNDRRHDVTDDPHILLKSAKYVRHLVAGNQFGDRPASLGNQVTGFAPHQRLDFQLVR